MELLYTSPSTIEVPTALTDKIYVYKSGVKESFSLALLGIEEFRGNQNNEGCESAPDAIRKTLFELQQFPKIKILDAGNIKMGQNYKDSFYALKSTVEILLEHKIIPIILGGDKTLLAAQQAAYKTLEYSYTNILHVDEKFNLGKDFTAVLDETNYLDHIVNEDDSIVFNFTNIGHQSYFMDDFTLSVCDRLGFDTHRLGEVKADMQEVEPIIRDNDILAFNVSALRQADAPGFYKPTPNGFSADEACQILRYAGLSDKLSSVGIFGYNPNFDRQKQTAQLLGQAIWYFIEGFSHRKKDYPVVDENDFNKYIVSSKTLGFDITFMKSKKSDRWWIRLPDEHVKYKSHQMMPCSYKDYQLALKDEIPNRWWKAYNKLV